MNAQYAQCIKKKEKKITNAKNISLNAAREANISRYLSTVLTYTEIMFL